MHCNQGSNTSHFKSTRLRLRGLVENKIEDKFYFRNHNFHQENC